MRQIIKPENCEFLNTHDLPALVLALDTQYTMKDTSGWRLIKHYSAGHGCHSRLMYGKLLLPREEIKPKLHDIDYNWYDTDTGIFGTSLDDVLKYRSQLNEILDVDCNQSYHHFEEAIYPIDCTPENIRKLAVDPVPDSLDQLIVFDSGVDRMLGVMGRWKLYILGDNCD
jgi:hypothetical protein